MVAGPRASMPWFGLAAECATAEERVYPPTLTDSERTGIRAARTGRSPPGARRHSAGRRTILHWSGNQLE